ncbi:uncharacterized protein LOC129875663 [Solanum dulcamara]|uniref:uncharacterized protein LOC129875663 n=1 Tax=Solanum dulcamara TaxID=45834 RepID=UPI0024865915|nr:uncharacterized protein LOC129875663 [Solanum dulcamara]
MTGSSASDQDGLGLVTIPRDEPEASEGRDPILYNEHIANLMQQMANMQREIDRLRNLTNLSISLNTPLPEHRADATIPPVDSPSPQDFLPNPSPFKTNMTAPKQPVNQPQVNFANINSQQTNPLPFTTPYVSQTPVIQTTLTQAPLTETNPLTQKAPLTQANPLIQKYQTIQHIPVTHTTTPNMQYVPQVYVTEAQPFVTPIPTMPEVDPYEEMERKARSKADESVAREIHNLKEAFKSIQLHKECEGFEYEDLCVHPDVELPVGYKVPKFDVFDGKGNPRAHLRSYCDKLVGVGKDEAIRMKLFIRSLTGEALDWYTSQDPKKWHSWSIMAQDFMDRFKFNTEAIPDRFYLMKLEKKSTESFREYAMRWRADAAKVQPPMTESEMTSLFIQSQKDATYYEKMISVVGQKFFEVVRMGEFIEEGIKTGRITNLAALQATSKAIQSDSIGGAFKKKKDGVSAVMTIQERRPNQMLTYQNPLPQPSYHSQYTQVPQPYYQPSVAPYPVYTTQPIYYPSRAPTYPNTSQYRPTYPPQPHYQTQIRPSNPPRPRPNFERRPPKTYTPLAEPLSQLYERLRTAGILQPIQARIPNPLPGWYDDTKHCVYHSGAAGHDTENCLTLKDKIEALIKEGVIQLRGAAPNVNNNPLPNHENVNMITIDEECNLEGTILPIKEEKNVMASAFIAPIITIQARAPFEVEVLVPKPKITVLVAQSTHFDTKAVPWSYSTDTKDKGKGKVVVEVAAAGMTRSGRCYAPEGVARIVPNKEVNQKKVVTEAEIEDFWRKMPTKEYSVVEQLKKTPAQISLMSLLMSSETHRSALVKVLSEAYVPANITSENLSAMVGQVLEANKVCFHEKELPSEVIGEIDLPLQIGPEEFVVEFQVLDIPASYNLLLGRPWIHMAGAVPSTLHQNLKFVWNHHEIIVHGEGSNSMYPENSIPVVESMEELDGSVFHTKEIMCVHQTERVKLPRVLVMVAWEMLKNGFMPGRGLGVNLGGIVEPIQLSGQKYTFGLGYKPTPEEVSLADLKRKSDISLPHPIPHLNQSFSKAYIIKESEEDAENTLVEGRKNLFIEEAECNMILEDCTEIPTIWDVEPGDALNNWTYNPSPFPRKSCEQINESANTENVTCNEMSKQISNTEQSFAEYEEEVQPEELTEDFEHFENKIKPNLDETETVNLGDSELMKETRISIHLTLSQRKELIDLLGQYMDVFAWSYDDMPGLSTNIVSHKLPTDPSCPPVKQKPRKIKPDLSLKVKEVSKQINANVIRVTKYPTWLANIVPVPKKDGKIRVCVDYRDLNKASPKDDFPLPNIHILIDNCAKHELQSFVDCFAGYHQILMDEEDADKTAFITPWGVYCYRVMPFGLKNAGATYMRAMTTIFHDMIHKEIEVYVDDVIIKSQKSSNHLTDLKKFFDRLRRYNLKLNPAKCAFGVPAGKLLGFIVSRKGIELDPSKIKAIQDLPPPKSRKDVMSFLGRLNYISRFIAQSTIICEPIFKLLRKDAAIKWTEDCQQAFDRIKEYLSSPPVLVPPKPGRPLLLYMSVSDNAFGCVLGQHDETGRKEQAIYYLSKKFTPYEARYTLLERTCCALTWVAQKLRHYLCAYTTFLISRMDPLKYIFQKPMPTGKLAKWQILLSEFDIIYVTQKAIKGQALADHLAENPVDEEYEPLKTYFPDEEVLFIGEDILEEYHGWRMFFDAKFKFLCTNNMAEYEACILGLRMAVDMNIQELLVIGDSDLLIHQVQGEWSTKNVKILPYLQCVKEICKKFIKIEFRHIPRAQNEFADALATMSSMIQHPDKNYIDPIKINVQDQPAYCFHVDEEIDGEPWYYDIVRYLKEGDYPEGISNIQKRTLRRLANHFFLSGEILYRRTPDLGLLRCVDSQEASKLIEEIHGGTCGPHMNCFTLAKKIVRAGYFWMTMETDCIRFVRKSWGMDVIGPIEPAASNGHRFILVAIDYFTKWVEASSHKSVTKKVVTDFVRNNIVCRFGIPHSIITDNGANLNSGLMHEICDKFKIIHRNSTPYRPQMNGAVEAANKNIKRLLVYGTEAVLPMEVEIPSLRIIQEAELSDAKWIQSRYEQLMLIDEKRMNAVCHGQLYQHRMAKAFNKKVRLRQFRPGQLVLKRIFPHQEEAKGKFAPNWHGPYVVHRVLTGGAVILAEMDGKIWPKAINSDAIKKYYV